MGIRVEWWMLSLLLVVTVKTDDSSSCRCVFIENCPKDAVEHLGPTSSCYELGMVHCCPVGKSDKQTHSKGMVEAIAEHLMNEATIQSGIDSYLQKVGESSLHTEDRKIKKSIRNNFKRGTTTSSLVGFENKENRTEIYKDTAVRGSQGSQLHVSSDRFSVDGALKKDKMVMEEPNSGKTNYSNKVFIVYAENLTTNNEDDIHPFIVMPALDNTSEQMPQNGSEETNIFSELLLKTSEIPSEIKKLKDNYGKTIEPEMEEEEGELFKAGSEIEEVKSADHFPATLIDNKSDFKLPIHTLPRHFKPQPAKVERNKQSNTNVLALLKEQSKGRLGIKFLNNNGEMIQNILNDQNKAALMDEINIKTINNIMQTNFTNQGHFLRRPNTVLQNKPIVAQINSETETSTEQVTKPSIVKSVHRFPQTGRLRVRNQSSTQPLSLSTSQVDVSKPTTAKSITQQSSRRRTSSSSKNVESSKPDEHNSMSGSIQKIRGSDESDIVQQTFTWERLQPRIKTMIIDPKSVSSSSTEEQAKTKTPSKTSYLRSRIRDVYNEDGEINDFPHFIQNESESLEISGSENTPQNSQPAMFNLPEIESGFQPMIRPRKLNVIGPIPVGFRDTSRGFHSNDDNVGLEPPHVSSTQDFNSQPHLNKNEVFAKKLLPPEYRYQDSPQSYSFSEHIEGSEIITTRRPAITESSFKFKEIGELLPPVVLPTFLQLAEEPSPTFGNVDLAGVKSTFPLETMVNDQKGLPQLKQEFDTLTNKYEQILQRYAEVLSGYNERYRQQINSD